MQARNFTTNVPKILDLKSSSEQIFFRQLSLGAPGICLVLTQPPCPKYSLYVCLIHVFVFMFFRQVKRCG